MLGKLDANYPWAVEFYFDDERDAFCLGNGWWLLYELEPNIDSEQHAAPSNGSSNGDSLAYILGSRATWRISRWHNRPKH